MRQKFNNSKKSIKDFGEVFTPDSLVNEMLDKLPPECFTDNKSFLDNSCGNGQFLCAVLERKIENGFSHLESLKEIYGVELCPDNVVECKTRLTKNSIDPEIDRVLKSNIINADALDPTHIGWSDVGFYWGED
jgi:type I restriction-modification system DNA methylase subunit